MRDICNYVSVSADKAIKNTGVELQRLQEQFYERDKPFF